VGGEGIEPAPRHNEIEDLKGELAELELRISRLEGMAGV
jgi:hypothetical protein